MTCIVEGSRAVPALHKDWLPDDLTFRGPAPAHRLAVARRSWRAAASPSLGPPPALYSSPSTPHRCPNLPLGGSPRHGLSSTLAAIQGLSCMTTFAATNGPVDPMRFPHWLPRGSQGFDFPYTARHPNIHIDLKAALAADTYWERERVLDANQSLLTVQSFIRVARLPEHPTYSGPCTCRTVLSVAWAQRSLRLLIKRSSTHGHSCCG